MPGRSFVSVVATMAIAAATLVSPPAQAVGPATYVVAPSGSDAAPGTADQPFATLQHALTALSAGDTLLVRQGVYDEQIRDPSIRPGLPGLPVTVAAWPGERPVLRGLLWLHGASFWTFRGLNVTWSAANHADEHMVKLTDGVGWTFADAEVWGAHSYAGLLVAGNAVGWQLQRLFIHDTYATHAENQDHLLYVNAGVGGGVVEGCVLAHSANGQAIKVGGPSDSVAPVGTLVIRNNTMYDNRGPSNVQLDYTAVAVQLVHNLMVGVAAGRANVTAYKLIGAGNDIVDNIGWGSAAVVGGVDVPGSVVEVANGHFDPELADPEHGNFAPTNPAAAGYGAS